MEAGQEEADPKVGEQDRHEAQHRQPGYAATVPAF